MSGQTREKNFEGPLLEDNNLALTVKPDLKGPRGRRSRALSLFSYDGSLIEQMGPRKKNEKKKTGKKNSWQMTRYTPIHHDVVWPAERNTEMTSELVPTCDAGDGTEVLK